MSNRIFISKYHFYNTVNDVQFSIDMLCIQCTCNASYFILKKRENQVNLCEIVCLLSQILFSGMEEISIKPRDELQLCVEQDCL